jgi:cap2 methyltransferase
MININRINNIKDINFEIKNCKMDKKLMSISYKNPHCTEYFSNNNNIYNCTNCYNYLKNKMFIEHKNIVDKQLKKLTCDVKELKKCSNGYLYNIIKIDENNNYTTNNIDKYKNINDFEKNTLITKYDDVKYVVDYENTYPKPKTVVHWGQLKMLLTTLVFFYKTIYEIDKEIHIIYAGSAIGDNILLLCNMFPNIKWYLIDPRKHNKLLYNHNQVIEIKEEYFTNEIATEYYNRFKNRKYKLLFISDIREGTEDEKVLLNQESNIKWAKIIKPDYSYFKFRCGYETDEIYKYYKGKILLQIYAPQSSTETRIMFKKNIRKCEYNIKEYQGKMLYFNRILRPSYYTNNYIQDNNIFDHCYDCTYFGKIIKIYIKKYKNFNYFKLHKNKKNILKIMNTITNFLSKYSSNKIIAMNKIIKSNILMS